MFKQQASPKYYVYNPDGKQKKFVETSAIDIPDFVGPQIDPAKQRFLKTNPFLYNPETADFPVLSIEDFLVKVGKNEIALGDVIRNPEISYSKRRRIIKNAFRLWNKDYNNKKNSAFIDNERTVEVISEVTSLKFSWKSKLLLAVLLFFTVFMIGFNSYLWDKFSLTIVGNYFYLVINRMYTATAWLRVVGNLSVYLILITIFYSLIYNLISKDFSKNYRLAKTYLDRSENNISQSYKKRWRKARSYYLRAIKKHKNLYFPPLDIGSVQEGQMNIAIFQQICQSLIDRAYKYKKTKPIIKFFKHTLMILCIAGAGTLFIFLIYNIILSIFN